ncbi:MAG: DoxX family protein [Flavobacteriales bacterium]|nr:DoxX family protein [Flavobacteriales bacterium]
MSFLIFLLSVQVLSILLSLMKFISHKFMISIIRFSYASFLLFSGFVKLIDPLGFSYKLQEYFEVFGFDFLIPFSLLMSIFVILFEMFLGICLILGIHVRKIVWGNLMLMVFFTFLTFFSAYFNKVTDCGCFGDFMKLDPWTSFTKDIYLLIISFLLLFSQQYITPLTKSIKMNNGVLLISFIILLFIPIHALSFLPFIDFRPYKIGVDIIKDKNLPENAKQDVFKDIWYYEVNGEIKEFSTDDEPWKIDGAIFKDRSTLLVSKGDEPKIKDFDLVDEITDVNMTDSILNMDKVILVISHDIQKTNIAGHQKIHNLLNNISKESTFPVYGLSSSSIDEIKNKLSKSDLLYPYFLVDQTTLKTMIRANPGIFLLQDGIVIEKMHWRDLPDDISMIMH